VGNAIKFTTKGSIKIIVRYNQAANWLEIDVKDTGIGILNCNLPNLFMPFWRMPETKHLNKNGIGLNLFIAKLICKKLKGKVSASSIKG
jgi:signal transduction histidine kinase